MTEIDIIWKLGLRTTQLSSRQLVAALRIVHMQEDTLYFVTKNLYPRVAEQFNTKPTNVERNIRSVAERCWYQGNRELLQQMAGRTLSKPPSAQEFIDILATYRLRQEQNTHTSGQHIDAV